MLKEIGRTNTYKTSWAKSRPQAWYSICHHNVLFNILGEIRTCSTSAIYSVVVLWRTKFSSDLMKPCWKLGESLSFKELDSFLVEPLWTYKTEWETYTYTYEAINTSLLIDTRELLIVPFRNTYIQRYVHGCIHAVHPCIHI